MKDSIRISVGMDVHQERISICWLRGAEGVEEYREILNDAAQIRRFFAKLKKEGDLRVCYEAGPCGYVVRRQLEGMGVSCEVIAPSLIPRKAGDKVKTDRRDAQKLARLYRAGELTAIRIPTEQEEATRDLVRCREDLIEDVTRHRHHVLKFLGRHGRVWRETKNWTLKHWTWLREQSFELAAAQRTYDEYLAQLDYSLERVKRLTQELEDLAQQSPWKEPIDRLRCLRGISTLSAWVLLTEIQDFHRFAEPRALMNFLGLTPGIHASGGKEQRLSITKAGNEHARRILVEAAWNYRHRPQTPAVVMKRCQGQPGHIYQQAREAQERLHYRYTHLVRTKHKKSSIAAVAVARELVGFVWAIMTAARSRRATAQGAS